MRLAALAVAAGGCADELPHFGTLRYEGDNLEVWASEGLSACGGTYAYLDTWISALREHLGEHARPEHQIFEWLDPEDYADTPCGQPSRGCSLWNYNRVYSQDIPHEHELVHAELDTRNASSVFTEGVAEMFGSRGQLVGDPDPFPIADLLAPQTAIPGTGYRTAGRFARYLTETHGLDAFLAAVLASPRKGGEPGIDRVFADVLDIGLDEVVAEFETYAPCDTIAWRYFDDACTQLAVTPWVRSDRWQTTFDLDCAADDAIGPRSGRFWALRALEVTRAGDHEISREGGEGVSLFVVPCALSCFDEDSPVALSLPSGTARLALEPGRYWIRAEAPEDVTTSVDVRIERLQD